MLFIALCILVALYIAAISPILQHNSISFLLPYIFYLFLFWQVFKDDLRREVKQETLVYTLVWKSTWFWQANICACGRCPEFQCKSICLLPQMVLCRLPVKKSRWTKADLSNSTTNARNHMLLEWIVLTIPGSFQFLQNEPHITEWVLIVNFCSGS